MTTELRDLTTIRAPTVQGETARWRVIVRFGEIVLKRGNRRWFMQRLRDNVERSLRGLPVSQVSIRPNRCFLHVHDVGAWDEIRERLARVCGVKNFSLALEVPRSMEAMKEAYDILVSKDPGSFRVRAQRGDKTFPLNSMEIEREIGAYIQAKTGARVDLVHGELTYGLEVQREGVFAFVIHETGPGGLPVGTAGRVVVLLSGGIDSPVAAYRMLRRGCNVELVHFTSYPFTDSSSWDKARSLAAMLNRYQFETRLHVVPLGEVQQRVVVELPARYRVLIYRRMMLRIAEEIARRSRSDALVTGESIGQVGSQTLTNITSIERAIEMPVFRPLIGDDKLDIINEAQRIGTYDTSIEPDMDCCQYMMPKSVATSSTPERLERIEEALDIPALVALALDGVEVETFRWPEE